ncbi:MAG: twin-arginine translocation signal domain-containing protein [Planctomycetes bacterium]|nr:twin-arginine translocation signal domain-containing protein [Planctomycetota bacterium]
MESIDRRDVTRRTFLEAAGAAGATLGAAGCAAAKSQAYFHSRHGGTPDHFNRIHRRAFHSLSRERRN